MIEAYGAMDIKMNGSCYRAINGIDALGESASGRVVDFGGVEVILRAVVEYRIWQRTVGGSLYEENEVQRTTICTCDERAIVYDLTSPEGATYRIQSYSQIVDSNLTIDDLETLGDLLALPEGWRSEAWVLAEREQLAAGGLAFVILKELGNSCQRLTE